jgi:hypothetical protein
MNPSSDRKKPISEIEGTVYVDMIYLIMSLLVIIGTIYFASDLINPNKLTIFVIILSVFSGGYVFVHKFIRLTK